MPNEVERSRWPDLFTASSAELTEYRLRQVRELVAFANERSPWHRERLARAGVRPEDIRTLDDFHRLPLMTKSDIRNFSDELNTVLPRRTCEVFSTSGTSGTPITLRYSFEDFEQLGKQGGELVLVGGVEPGDLYQLTFPLGARMWVAGLNMWWMMQRAGVGTVRFGTGSPDVQLETAMQLGVNGILLTGGFARRLGQLARDRGLLAQLAIRKLFIVNENIIERDLSYNALGQALMHLWPGREIRAIYGNTELGLGGIECGHHAGYHTHPGAHFYEVLDPLTGKPQPPGVPGRLVVTSLLYRGMPLLRYCIDDVTFLQNEPCACGVTSERVGPILGRLDALLKPKGGASVYPESIESLLDSIAYVREFDFEAHREGGTEDVRVFVALEPSAPEDATREIREVFSRHLHFRPQVLVESPEVIARRVFLPNLRKPQRYRDLRGKS